MKKTYSTYIICLLLFLFNCSAAFAQRSFSVFSPDGETRLSVRRDYRKKARSKRMVPYSMRVNLISHDEHLLVERRLDMTVKSHGHRYTFDRANLKEYENKLIPAGDSTIVESDGIVLGGSYGLMKMVSEDGIVIELRVYNNGVAYRYGAKGIDGEYKIINTPRLLLKEKGTAIWGTFTGDYMSPWHVMRITAKEEVMADGWIETVETQTAMHNDKVGVIPWKDAPLTATVGVTFDRFYGGEWQHVGTPTGVVADFTYKYLYFGTRIVTNQELLYIFMHQSYPPFDNVIGGIDTQILGGRLGFSIPIQRGHDIFSITPYVGFSNMHLTKHGNIRVGFSEVDPQNYFMVGPGLKLQWNLPEQFIFGVSYEHQFLTRKLAPVSNGILTLSVGCMF